MNKKELFWDVSEFAAAHSMKCELGKFGLCEEGDFSISVSYQFFDGFYIIQRSDIYHVRYVGGGKVQYWYEDIHDGRHHISGPGYGSCISGRKPITIAKLRDDILDTLRQHARYYEPMKRE